MTLTASKWIAISILSMIVAGCTSVPADYAGTLSKQDPKWSSPQCQQVRLEAQNYKQRNVSWAAGALIGPYGLALAAAGKEQQEKQRIAFARKIHEQCSSLPLPKKLQVTPVSTRKIKSTRA